MTFLSCFPGPSLRRTVKNSSLFLPAARRTAAAGPAAAPGISPAAKAAETSAAGKARVHHTLKDKTNKEIPQLIQAEVIAEEPAENLQEEPQHQPEEFHM